MLIAFKPEFPCAAASGKSQASVFLREPNQILKLQFEFQFSTFWNCMVLSELHKPWWA